jgi:hypothetical protein
VDGSNAVFRNAISVRSQADNAWSSRRSGPVATAFDGCVIAKRGVVIVVNSNAVDENRLSKAVETE